ncbi:MAG TPA: response regulator [Rhizomicrobium sp.]|jgi:CheY-like chemotaxis protein|nr:response regulator [Rhizomicrobium sp.]
MSASKSHPAVLIVEDEWLVRMSAADALVDEGYDVVEAGDAEQALAQIAARPDIALMFTDINMPGDMDGIALARAVHTMRPDIHIILTSGKKLPCTDHNAKAFVPKPYTPEHLLRLFDGALN